MLLSYFGIKFLSLVIKTILNNSIIQYNSLNRNTLSITHHKHFNTEVNQEALPGRGESLNINLISGKLSFGETFDIIFHPNYHWTLNPNLRGLSYVYLVTFLFWSVLWWALTLIDPNTIHLDTTQMQTLCYNSQTQTKINHLH